MTDFVRVKLYYGTVVKGNVVKLRIANRRSFATEYPFVILERSEESTNTRNVPYVPPYQ